MFSASKTKSVSGAVSLTKSLRFRSSASAYLSRTPASVSNQQKWTWSAWVKISQYNSTPQQLFSARASSASSYTLFYLTSAPNFGLQFLDNGGANIVTNAVYRDPSAWYHVMISVDTTQATASNRVFMYVNGVSQTFNSPTYPSINSNLNVNSTQNHNIGAQTVGTIQFFDGYMTDVYLIDGQQLTPSSFGATNATTGVWGPAKYTGTYGTNGFHLTFANTTSTTTLGYDTSGNGNNWTTNNISLTAGSTYDSMNDVSTLTSSTASNYCVVNPLLKGGNLVIASGNLNLNSNTNWTTAYGTFLIPTSGKWYWEVTAGGSNTYPGIASVASNLTGNLNTYPSDTIVSYSYYGSNGNKVTGPGNSSASYGATFTTGDVIGIAFDAGTGTLTFYKNNTSQGTAFSSLTGQYVPSFGVYDFGVQSVNFGQQGFTYTPPSGFVALNTYNLPTPTIVNGTLYMDASLYTGNRTARSITNPSGFKPDFVWIKARNSAEYNTLTDSNRGVNSQLFSDRANAQETNTDAVTSFNSNGFSLGTNSTGTFCYVNQNSSNYVAWQWQAGQGTNTTNTNGSITSTVSVNTTAGFSIVTYTNAASGTVGHGLGVAPAMVIYKDRASAYDWVVLHQSLTNMSGYYLKLNTTAAAGSGLGLGGNPTSSVIYTNSSIIGNGDASVAYCFAQIAGFSAFGSYVGNGSATGPFVYLGFKPKFIIVKSSTRVTDWNITDGTRNPSDSINYSLNADTSGTETTFTLFNYLSNGFQVITSDTSVNSSGDTYIYMAFASNPFKYSNSY